MAMGGYRYQPESPWPESPPPIKVAWVFPLKGRE
jgi:hypothetical protein